MTSAEALVLGLVQGLTEFLPISSTAHLKIVPSLLGWEDPGAAFTAVVQIGTLIAVLLYFRRDIARLIVGTLAGLREGRPLGNPDARLAWMIAAGTVPIVVCGLLFESRIETTFRSLYVIASALIGLALLLMAAEWLVGWRRKRGMAGKGIDKVGWGDALLVGLAQALALVPGTSRSGVTITGGLFAGMGRETAARFSFLLSLPSVFAAGAYETYKLYKAEDPLLTSSSGVSGLLLATVVAGVAGYASIAFLLRFLQTHTTSLFIVYRLALGALLLWLLTTGRLAP